MNFDPYVKKESGREYSIAPEGTLVFTLSVKEGRRVNRYCFYTREDRLSFLEAKYPEDWSTEKPRISFEDEKNEE